MFCGRERYAGQPAVPCLPLGEEARRNRRTTDKDDILERRDLPIASCRLSRPLLLRSRRWLLRWRFMLSTLLAGLAFRSRRLLEPRRVGIRSGLPVEG